MNAPDANLDAAAWSGGVPPPPAPQRARRGRGCRAARRGGTPPREGSGGDAALRPADWLGLAAAPTFAVMALVTGVSGGAPSDMLCAAAREASPLGGMVPMYVLMSAFHLAPWLKLISGAGR